MSRIARILASGTTLLLAIAMTTGIVSARFADDSAEIINAQKDMAKLAKMYADAMKNGNKVDAKKVSDITVAMKKKYDDLGFIMAAYKPSEKKGLGYNPAKKGKGDGLETRLIALADTRKKPLSAAQLAKEKELLIRMAIYNLVIHDVTSQFPPPKKPGKGLKEWTKYNTEMKEGSESLITAVKANDAAGLKKAALKITSSCNDCHTDFRD